MKSELVEELLAGLMNWDRAAFLERVKQLEALALCKFDEYGNFRPGIKFFESLASWLNQFDPDGRAVALNFVMEHLVFLSDAEMTHLIELVYPDHIEPVLRSLCATRIGISTFAVAKIVGARDYATLRRRSLILGASDGARLDRLRRSASWLSHEQFLQGCEPPADLVAPMVDKLKEALAGVDPEAPATFAHVFLVDDFAGSGRTLLRFEDGAFRGKLVKLHAALGRLRETQLLDELFTVTVILYCATQQAEEHLGSLLIESGLPPWEIRIVQRLPLAIRVNETDPSFAALAHQFYDEILTDDHKGRAPLGYADCALPLVLSHNTPNNSVSLLWADTTEEPGGAGRRALFPRYERHHRDRP